MCLKAQLLRETPDAIMALSATFLLIAVAGCVGAAAGQQMMQDDSYTVFVNRIQALEEITRKQAQVIENIVSEKQSLEIRVKRLEAQCSFSDVIFPGGGNAIENEAAGLSPEDAASQTQKRVVVVRSDDTDPLEPVVTQLTKRVNEVSADLQALKDEVSTKWESLTSEGSTNTQSLKSEFDANLQDLTNKVANASTSVYVRWGSSTCPSPAVLVYSGVVGGSRYDETGGAANYLCLPMSNLALTNRISNKNAYLFGAEYETHDQHQNKDALCAVCRSSRATNVMIPATTVCPAGWTSEYSGWLMGGYLYDAGASEFICVDKEMAARDASDTDNDGRLLFYTVTVCGSLPCTPYIHDKNVKCVVCSK